MKNFINENSFSRLLKRMGHWYSNAKNDKDELKDIVTISASRTRLVDIVNNDEILKNDKYIIGENKWDVDAIAQDLMDGGTVLIDKELEVVWNDKRKKYVIQSVEEYTNKELEIRNKILHDALNVKKYAIASIGGSYRNDSDKDVETNEESFFAVNIHNDPNFLTNISKMSEYFNQDCFIIKAAQDDDAFLVGTNDSTYPKYHELESIGKLEDNKYEKEYNLNKAILNNNIEYLNKFNNLKFKCCLNVAKNGRTVKENDQLNGFMGTWEVLQNNTKMLRGRNAGSVAVAIKQNRNWDWLDEMRNNIDVFDDVEFLYERFVYEDYNDFLNRVETHNPAGNGVTKEFLNEFYNGDIKQWILENKDNTLCFNCKNCVDCKNCNECFDCINCRFCEDCENCNNCKRSKKCIGCVKCDRCENCENLEKLYMYHDNAKYIY